MSSLKQLRKMLSGEDSYGNSYLVNPYGVILLKPLRPSDRLRNIGRLVKKKNDDLCYVKFEEESQRFRKTDAWSINYRVLQVVDYVYFVTSKDMYKISHQNAMEKGDFMHFKNTTEKKLYVPIKYWDKKSEIIKANRSHDTD